MQTLSHLPDSHSSFPLLLCCEGTACVIVILTVLVILPLAVFFAYRRRWRK
jgi:hypothetical protein